MVEKFISPNWHVILIHYPIGLLTTGIIIELISLAWPRDRFRAAGRWMIIIGGLLSVTAAMAGIYAFRDVVTSGPANPDFKWQSLLQQNHWIPEQWTFIKRHLLLNSIAVVIFLAVIAVWLSRGDAWRKRYYPLMLILLIAGIVLVSIGAWFGGELVYRYGTAINPQVLAQRHAAGAGTEVPHALAEEHKESTEEPEAAAGGLQWYVPPLQLHITLAGFAFALAVAALGLTFHGWTRSITSPETGTIKTPGPIPPNLDVLAEEIRMPAGWFWLVTFIVGLIAALAGAWSVMGEISRKAVQEDLAMLREPDHRRLLLHVIGGLSFVVLGIILAILVRVTRQYFTLKGVLVFLLILAAVFQVWVGTLMLFDSHEGPLFRFSPSGEAKAATTQPAPQVKHGTPAATKPGTATAPGH